MSPTTRPISFSSVIRNKVRYTLAFIKDPMGKKGAVFTCEEPDKAADETFFTEEQLKALNLLMAQKK